MHLRISMSYILSAVKTLARNLILCTCLRLVSSILYVEKRNRFWEMKEPVSNFWILYPFRTYSILTLHSISELLWFLVYDREGGSLWFSSKRTSPVYASMLKVAERRRRDIRLWLSKEHFCSTSKVTKEYHNSTQSLWLFTEYIFFCMWTRLPHAYTYWCWQCHSNKIVCSDVKNLLHL